MSNKNNRSELTDYERAQIKEIEAWKKEEPGVVSQTFGVILEPAAWVVRKIVPEKAVQGAIDGANSAAVWLTDTDDIKRDAHVNDLSDLRSGDLSECDKLADNSHNWALGIAISEGAVTGAFGIFGAPVDIPAIITIAIRTT